jgi:hypothetical protein
VGLIADTIPRRRIHYGDFECDVAGESQALLLEDFARMVGVELDCAWSADAGWVTLTVAASERAPGGTIELAHESHYAPPLELLDHLNRLLAGEQRFFAVGVAGDEAVVLGTRDDARVLAEGGVTVWNAAHRHAQAIAELYRAFARYRRPPLALCTHCYSDDEIAHYQEVPLRELADRAARRLLWETGDHWPSTDVYRHFLPRLVELFDAGMADLYDGHFDEVLAYHRVATWPAEERRALQRVRSARGHGVW